MVRTLGAAYKKRLGISWLSYERLWNHRWVDIYSTSLVLPINKARWTHTSTESNFKSDFKSDSPPDKLDLTITGPSKTNIDKHVNFTDNRIQFSKIFDWLTPKESDIIPKDYDSTINQIINDHKLKLREMLGLSLGDAVREWNSIPCQELLFAAMNPIEFDTKEIIYRVRELSNQCFREVQQSRKKVERQIEPSKKYDAFLSELYANPDKHNHKDLWNAYSALPSPQPLYIEPVHFEKFLHVLSTKSERNKVSVSSYINVLHDMSSCGLLVSAREEATAIALIGETINDQDLGVWDLMEERYSRLVAEYGNSLTVNSEDIVSALNVMINVASRLRANEWLSKVEEEFKKYRLEPDRFTLLILMRHYSNIGDFEVFNRLLEKAREKNIILDISMINLSLNCLIKSGHIDYAEELLQTLVQYSLLPREDNSSIVMNLTRNFERSRLRLIDSLCNIVKSAGIDLAKYNYRLPLIANYYTFIPFANYYAREGDFKRLSHIISTMYTFECSPSRHFFYKILKICETSSMWTLTDVSSMTNMICQLHFESNRYLLTTVMAKKVYDCFCSKLHNNMDINNQRLDELYSARSVYDFLQQLLNIAEKSKYDVVYPQIDYIREKENFEKERSD